jgi:hypothetical protein
MLSHMRSSRYNQQIVVSLTQDDDRGVKILVRAIISQTDGKIMEMELALG